MESLMVVMVRILKIGSSGVVCMNDVDSLKGGRERKGE